MRKCCGQGIKCQPEVISYLKKLMKLIVTLMMCSLFLGGSPVFAGGERVDLTVEGETLSASLREIPLKIILERLERRKGVRFKGADSLFDEEVTVQFNALILEDRIKRILASMNYSLVFNRMEESIS